MASPRPLLRASDGFLNHLDRQGDAAVSQMLARYDDIQRRLLDAIDKLDQQMRDLESPTKAQLYQLDRYQTMIQQVNDEMSRMGRVMAGQIPGVTRDAGKLGMQAAEELVKLQSSEASITAAFNRLDVAGVQRAASFVSPQSPLTQMLQAQYGPAWASVIAAQYVTGVALGQSPRVVVASLKQTVEVAMPADLDRIIRTAQLYSYRQTNHAAWQQSGVVDTWTWSSALDDRVCASCWSQHGSVHPVGETLNDHHRGRCAAVPNVAGEQPLDVPTGEDVFNQRNATEQARIAGEGGWGAQYRAYKDGAITFDQMSGTHHDDIYGPMRAANSLKAILGDAATKYYAGGAS